MIRYLTVALPSLAVVEFIVATAPFGFVTLKVTLAPAIGDVPAKTVARMLTV